MDCFCIGNERCQLCSVIGKLKLTEVEKFVPDYTTNKWQKRDFEANLSESLGIHIFT